MSKGYQGISKEDRAFDSFTRNIVTPQEETRRKLKLELEERRRFSSNRGRIIHTTTNY